MDKKKEFLIQMGERSADTGSADTLLKAKIEDRAAKRIEQQEEIDELAHEAKVAELKKKAAASDPATANAGAKKEPESPVKFEVKGGVNLGMIDFDAERKQAAADLKALKEEQESNLRAIGAQNEELRDKIHAKEMEMIQLNFKYQMDMLTKMIESNTSKGDFAAQLAAARAAAAELGYSPSSPGGGGGGDAMTQIKLTELQFSNQITLRKMDEESKERDRKYQLDLEELKDKREDRKLEQARAAKKDEMFAKAPEIVGRFIGEALRGGGMEGVGEEPQPESSVTSKANKPRPGIQAGVGEAGTADCLECKTTMAIGPTATKVICAKCGAEYPIIRVNQKITEAPTDHPAVNATEEEE